MRPILPWLAIFDQKILDRVRKVAPEVIFEGGDPSALPLPTRQEILAEVCERIAQADAMRSATEYAAVQRFAQPDIAEDIRRLMKQYGSNDRVVGFLTRMIWLGRLGALLPEAKRIALSPKASRYTRISAFRAVREIGSQQDQEEVRRAFLNEAPQLSREWIGELVTDLAPSKEEISWVLDVTAKSEEKERYTVDRMTDAITAFAEATPLQDLPQLLAGIGSLLDQEPMIERGYCEVSKRYSWLMKPAAHIVERLIKAGNRHALHSDSLEILNKFRAVREWDSEFMSVKVEFAGLIQNWPELNDASFWHDVSATRRVVMRKKGERLTDYWQAQIFGSFWKFDASDFDRVCEWIESRPDQDDKLVALSLAFAIYAQNGKRRAWREKLISVCASDSELEARLQQLLNPPPESLRYKKQERQWKWRAAAQTKRQAEQFEKDKAYVLTHIDLIRDPKFPNPGDLSRLQWYLHQKCHEKEGASNKWTEGRWRELIALFGEDVAVAYRDGAIAYWRNYKPVLRSEGAEANQTPAAVIFGLTGLEIESHESPSDLRVLSQSDAELATRYAMYELNGFPDWFQSLYETRKEIANKVILREIEYELSVGVPGTDTHYVLSDISWSAEWAWNDLALSFYKMLEGMEPKNDTHLHQLLKVIQGSQISDDDLGRLAASKVKEGNARHLPDWYAVWVGVDPDAALPMLAKHLSNLPSDNDRTDFAMRFVTKLWGERRSETFGARSRFRAAQHLKTLYLLMHQHIRVQDDIDRSDGGVYSPRLRDDAQEARNRILQALNGMTGKEAFIALEEIAVASRQTEAYSYLESLCTKKAEQDADLKPWSPANVREFHNRLDRTPSTHRELAELAVLRLLDLKDDLENGDDSVAAVVKAISEETVLRNYIGHELRQKAFGRYSISQEEELADSKKPDLRFHGVAIDAPVPTELKITDKWTGPALFERIENQLAGDYLRDIRSGRGIFALVHRDGLQRKLRQEAGAHERGLA
jgi:hypothetical protein